jgi:hypothetical protein
LLYCDLQVGAMVWAVALAKLGAEAVWPVRNGAGRCFRLIA